MGHVTPLKTSYLRTLHFWTVFVIWFWISIKFPLKWYPTLLYFGKINFDNRGSVGVRGHSPIWALPIETQLVSRWFSKLLYMRWYQPKFGASITKMHNSGKIDHKQLNYNNNNISLSVLYIEIGIIHIITHYYTHLCTLYYILK